MRETIKNVKYLLKLYLKYGCLPFVLAIIQGIISGTIITYISVNLSKIAIDGIISNAPFMSVLSLIIILFAIQLIFALLTQIVNTYVNQPFGIRLSAGIKQEVFCKVLNTDFAHFDKPKFYDDYTWTSKRLATQATQAASIVTSLISSLAKIIMLVVMISIIDPILVVFSVLSILVNGVLYKQVAKINFNHDSEYLPIEKRWNYLGYLP